MAPGGQKIIQNEAGKVRTKSQLVPFVKTLVLCATFCSIFDKHVSQSRCIICKITSTKLISSQTDSIFTVIRDYGTEAVLGILPTFVTFICLTATPHSTHAQMPTPKKQLALSAPSHPIPPLHHSWTRTFIAPLSVFHACKFRYSNLKQQWFRKACSFCPWEPSKHPSLSVGGVKFGLRLLFTTVQRELT